MSVPSVIDMDGFQAIEDIAKLYAKGVTSPHTIARRLGIKVVEARAGIEAWQEILRNDATSQDTARDALDLMTKRFDDLLVEANDNLDSLKSLSFDEKVSAQINATLKNIADFDAKRVDLLQKAGLLDAHDLGDELVEREEREAALIKILREDLCDHCKVTVRDRLSHLNNQAEGTVEAEVLHDDE